MSVIATSNGGIPSRAGDKPGRIYPFSLPRTDSEVGYAVPRRKSRDPTCHVTQHANDKLEVKPTLKALEQLPETLGKAEALLADTGHCSESNTKACDAAKITPYIAGAREDHHPPVEACFTEPPALAPDANVVEAMDHRLATVEGRAIYALRKSTVEPVYGIIKSALGFRQFHLRGLHSASGEWTLVTIAWNLKRLFNLRCAAARTAAAACLKASDTSPKHSILPAGRSKNSSKRACTRTPQVHFCRTSSLFATSNFLLSS